MHMHIYIYIYTGRGRAGQAAAATGRRHFSAAEDTLGAFAFRLCQRSRRLRPRGSRVDMRAGSRFGRDGGGCALLLADRHFRARARLVQHV